MVCVCAVGVCVRRCVGVLCCVYELVFGSCFLGVKVLLVYVGGSHVQQVVRGAASSGCIAWRFGAETRMNE
jgi:hypothetical protein